MTKPLLSDIVRSIPEETPVRLKLDLKNGNIQYLNGIFQEDTPPNFHLVVREDSIPTNIDQGQPCSLTLHTSEHKSLAISARISGISDDNRIELTAVNSIDPVSLREYFRVTFRTDIKISFTTGSDGKHQPRTLNGSTVDISASGILGLFPHDSGTVKNVTITFTLPHPQQHKITCVGHVVRTRKLCEGRYQVALHFDTISSKQRDAIITNCLHEQRKQLRERVQTAEN